MEILKFKIYKLYLLVAALNKYVSKSDTIDKELIDKEITEIELLSKEINSEVTGRPFS